MSSAGDLLRDKLQVPFEFNRIAGRYDLATSLSQGYSSDLDLSVRRMRLKGDEYVADLCCGTGKSTMACLQAVPGGKVLGVDFSDEMLNRAVVHVLPQFPGRVVFRRQNIMDIDDPDGSFDAIFMAYGIRNMPDYGSVASNLYRMLRPGGVIAFHEYSIEDTPASRIYWHILGYGLILPVAGILTGSTRIFRYLIRSVLDFLSPSEFITLLKETGFHDVQAVPLPGWRGPVLRTFLARKP